MLEKFDLGDVIEKPNIIKLTDNVDTSNVDVAELDRSIIDGQFFPPGEHFIFKETVIPEPPEPCVIREVITRNRSLEGDEHPITGVPFERKQVETINGEKVEGVFPVFDSTFDVQLPEDLYQVSDKEQFEHCNQKLKEAYDSGKLDDLPFNERQREQIANGDKPQGYTWHHNEELGKMELIDTETHDKTGHTGGKVIWGGGQDAR